MYSKENAGQQITDIGDNQEDGEGLIDVEISYYQQFHVSWALMGMWINILHY